MSEIIGAEVREEGQPWYVEEGLADVTPVTPGLIPVTIPNMLYEIPPNDTESPQEPQKPAIRPGYCSRCGERRISVLRSKTLCGSCHDLRGKVKELARKWEVLRKETQESRQKLAALWKIEDQSGHYPGRLIQTE